MYFEKGDEATIKIRQGFKLKKITVAQLDYIKEREEFRDNSPFAQQSGKRRQQCNKTTIIEYLVDNCLTEDEKIHILENFRKKEGI